MTLWNRGTPALSNTLPALNPATHGRPSQPGRWRSWCSGIVPHVQHTQVLGNRAKSLCHWHCGSWGPPDSPDLQTSWHRRASHQLASPFLLRRAPGSLLTEFSNHSWFTFFPFWMHCKADTSNEIALKSAELIHFRHKIVLSQISIKPKACLTRHTLHWPSPEADRCSQLHLCVPDLSLTGTGQAMICIKREVWAQAWCQDNCLSTVF